MMEFISLIILASLVSSTGGFLLKYGLNNLGTMILTPTGIFRTLVNPPIIAGLFIYFLGAIVWMKVLSKYPLSTAYPVLVGLSFSLITILSVFGLREQLNGFKLIGILGIIAGIILIVRNS